MLQAVHKTERFIKERREVDNPLINWWLYMFIVGPVTMGIYSIILYFKRINRIDNFINRKKMYYESILEFTEKYAESNGKLELVNNEIHDLRDGIDTTFLKKICELKAGLSLFFTVITFGIYGFFLFHKMNKVWYDLQIFEEHFNEKLSNIWTKLEIIKYPISFKIDHATKRSYGLYIALTLLTVGIWGIVWDYKMHIDPDNAYKEFHSVEDTILQSLRQVA